MLKFFKTSLEEEDGAVTVDWVVLTAAIVGLGVSAIAAVQTSVNTVSSNIKSGISNQQVGSPSP